MEIDKVWCSRNFGCSRFGSTEWGCPREEWYCKDRKECEETRDRRRNQQRAYKIRKFWWNISLNKLRRIFKKHLQHVHLKIRDGNIMSNIRPGDPLNDEAIEFLKKYDLPLLFDHRDKYKKIRRSRVSDSTIDVLLQQLDQDLHLRLMKCPKCGSYAISKNSSWNDYNWDCRNCGSVLPKPKSVMYVFQLLFTFIMFNVKKWNLKTVIKFLQQGKKVIQTYCVLCYAPIMVTEDQEKRLCWSCDYKRKKRMGENNE